MVAVDMRGYGESDLPPSTDCYRLDYLVTDVKDIVEYLGKRDGLCFILLLFQIFFLFNPNSLEELIRGVVVINGDLMIRLALCINALYSSHAPFIFSSEAHHIIYRILLVFTWIRVSLMALCVISPPS